MGEVFKFEPPEASQERQEMGNEAIDLMKEIEKRREAIEKAGEEAADLAVRLEEAEDKLSNADKARDFGNILFGEIEPLQMELAKKLAEKRRLGIEKLALASDLKTIRDSKFAGEIKMPETDFSSAEEAWFDKGESLSATMENLAKIKEEDALAAEEEFFQKAA
jgi:hypothetical protein